MLDNTLKWVGTLCTIGGAIATSASVDPLNVVLFNIGSIAWLIAAVRMRETALIAVNAGLLVIYMAGCAVRFF